MRRAQRQTSDIAEGMPGDMPAGNPEAIFDVVQLPTGEVLSPVRLKKSSGYKPYDDAIERSTACTTGLRGTPRKSDSL